MSKPILVHLQTEGVPTVGRPFTLVGTVERNPAYSTPGEVTVDQFGFLIPDSYHVESGTPDGMAIEPSGDGTHQRAYWHLDGTLDEPHTFQLSVTPGGPLGGYDGVLAMAWYPYPDSGVSETLWIRPGDDTRPGDVRDAPP